MDEKSTPAVTEIMDESEADVLAYFGLPKAHRVKINSTNTPERLNKEVKRRADVADHFLSEKSIMRLQGGGTDGTERGMAIAAEPQSASVHHGGDRPEY